MRDLGTCAIGAATWEIGQGVMVYDVRDFSFPSLLRKVMVRDGGCSWGTRELGTREERVLSRMVRYRGWAVVLVEIDGAS